jgi:hypothetical protein
MATSQLTMDEIQRRMGHVQLYAIFMRPTDKYDVSTDEGKELLRRHLQFQLDLWDRGILFAAGPLKYGPNDDSFYGFDKGSAPLIDANGMMMIAVRSRQEAEEIAHTEPFYQVGWRLQTICQWVLNEGQGVELAKKMLDARSGA